MFIWSSFPGRLILCLCLPHELEIFHVDSFPRSFLGGTNSELQLSELREEDALLIVFLSLASINKEQALEGGASDLSNFICVDADPSFQSCFQSDSDNRTAYR